MIEKTSLEKKKRIDVDLRPLIAFLLTFISLVAVFTINMIVPFGERNIFTSDLGAQYGPYLVGLKEALTSGQSLLYSRTLGLGGNTMGVFAYYLSSPLNLLVFLFPMEKIQTMVTILIMLKLSFAGAFMTWLLDRKFKSEDKLTVLFGIMYPLCSFAMVFMFNIMWLDGFALLPLLILLAEKFIINRKTWPVLTLVLLLLFVSGYYMAYMVGAFSFIYLMSIMGYYGWFSKEKQKEGLKTVGLFILSAVTAAMMSACILLPAGLNTIGNPDYTVNDGGLSMNPEFNLVSILDQLVEKKVEDLSINLPQIFCGVTALLLCILLFFNPSIKKSLKKALGAAFGFGLFSFQFPLLNRAWHLFDEPNWFNFRYSYVFSFVMILVAFYSYMHMGEAKKKHFFASLGIVAGIAVISQSFGLMAKEDNTFFATIILAALICALLYGKTLDKWPDVIYNLKKLGTLFLVCVIVIEIVIFNPRCYLPGIFSGAQDATEFEEMLGDLEELSSRIDDDGAYRTEIHYPWHHLVYSNNVPYYMKTQGISIFASMANKKTNHFLKQLGYRSNYNYFAMEHMNTILPADSILGVRYIVSVNHTISELRYKANVDRYYLYENDYALPQALLARSDAGGFDGFRLEKDVKEKDYFTFQEDWISSLSGLDASDIYETWTAEWEVMNGQKTDTPPEDVIHRGDTIDNTLDLEKKGTAAKALTYYLRNNDKAPMVLRTTFEAQRSGAIYFLIPYSYLQVITGVYVNDELISMTDSNSYFSQILNLGSFREGDTVKVDIKVDDAIFGSFAPIFAYLEPEAMAKHKDALTTGLQSITVENGHYVVQTNVEEDRLLIFTAPYEKGWKAFIDGQETAIVVYEDAFISVPLSAGTHTVELRFTPPGWKVGLLVSAAGLLLFVAMTVVSLRPKRKEEKAEPEEDGNSKDTETNVKPEAIEVAAPADDTKPDNEEEKK
ncbi:MAG: YfhO family protein [Clostridiales bacterium]|nr:YfhO family protein [Clostridiales bacterium]